MSRDSGAGRGRVRVAVAGAFAVLGTRSAAGAQLPAGGQARAAPASTADTGTVPDTGAAAVRARCGRLPASGWRAVYGTVRTADGAPVAGATVGARWSAAEDEPGSFRTRATDAGAYAFCRLPRDRSVAITAVGGRGLGTAAPVAVAASAGAWVVQPLVLVPGGAPATGATGRRPDRPRVGVAGDAPADTLATVQGVVTDSLSGRGVVRAVVQFVDPATFEVVATVTSDSAGRYRVGPFRPGRYLAGVIHPLLDARGLDQLTVRAVLLPGLGTLDFGIPAAGPGSRPPARRDTTAAPPP